MQNPIAPVLIDSNTLLFMDNAGLLVRQYHIPTGLLTTLAGSTAGNVDGTGTSAQFYYIEYVYYDRQRQLLLMGTDDSLRSLSLVTLQSGTVTTIDAFYGICGDTITGRYYYGLNAIFIYQYDTLTTTTTLFAGSLTGSVGDGVGTNARFSNLWGGEIDPYGKFLYVPDTTLGAIKRVLVLPPATITGVYPTSALPYKSVRLTLIGTYFGGGYADIGGVTMGPNGNEYICSTEPVVATLMPLTPRSTPSPADGPYSPAEVGVIFTVLSSGTITGISYYKHYLEPLSYSRLVTLWSGNGIILAQGSSKETSAGWNTVYFKQPVAVNGGIIYTASYGASQYYINDVYSYNTATTDSSYQLATPNNAGVFSSVVGSCPLSNSGKNYYVTPMFVPSSSGIWLSPTRLVCVTPNFFIAGQQFKFRVNINGFWSNTTTTLYTIAPQLGATEVVIGGGLTGTATGVADGIGTGALFTQPASIILDNNQTYAYIIDDRLIRRLTLSTGLVNGTYGNEGNAGIIDGTGTFASFDSILAMVLDNTNNCAYTTEYNMNAIRKINFTTNGVTTISGVVGTCRSNDGIISNAGYCSPLGMVLYQQQLFILDTQNVLLRLCDFNTNTVTTIAGQLGIAGNNDGYGTYATLDSSMSAIEIDTQRQVLYIAYANFIRMIGIGANYSYPVTTIMNGTGLPLAITYDSSGNLASIPIIRGMVLDSYSHLLYLTFQSGISILNLTSYTHILLCGNDLQKGDTIGGTTNDILLNNPRINTQTLWNNQWLYIADLGSTRIRRINVLPPPRFYSFYPRYANVNSVPTTITLYGEYFGGGVNDVSSITIGANGNEQLCLNTLFVSTSQLQCSLEPNLLPAGSNNKIIVTIGGIATTPLEGFWIPPIPYGYTSTLAGQQTSGSLDGNITAQYFCCSCCCCCNNIFDCFKIFCFFWWCTYIYRLWYQCTATTTKCILFIQKYKYVIFW